MSRYSKEELDRFFEYGIFAPKRLIYLGSHSADQEEIESGIDYKMAESAIKSLTYLDTISDKPITIILNNIGGDYYHAMSIFDIIVACRCHITIVCTGYCCSATSIILQAADTRLLTPNCVMMIHDGEESINGSPKTAEAWAAQSKKTRQKMYNIYLSKMKTKNPQTTLKQIEKMCAADTVFSSEEAVEFGLADEILTNFNEIIGE